MSSFVTVEGSPLAVEVAEQSLAVSFEPSPVAVEIEAEAEILAALEANALLVEIAAEQGPPGPAGADGGSILTKTAGAALGGNRAARVDAATGKAIYADNTVIPDAEAVLGITTGAAAEDTEVTIQTFGEMTEASWNWTPGLPVYLSTNGLLTQTPPTSGSLTQIGVANEATKLFIRIQEMILLA